MGRLTPIACFVLAVAGCGSPGPTVAATQPVTTSSLVATRSPQEPTTTVPVENQDEAAPDCRPEPFEYAPVDLDAIEYLVPFGLMTDSHVTPVDHQYFQNYKEPERRIEVYAPADGRVVSMQHFGAPVAEDPSGIVDDYRLVIEHTCTVSSIFIHIDELDARLEAEAPEIGRYSPVDIPVAAGDAIGWFTANVDYNLVDLGFVTDGLVDQSSYEAEPWKPHVPDTFDYFVPEIRARMEPLSLRRVEPRGGVFTHDIEGRLVGNWFEEGTDGYGGVDPDRYWAGHLAFAYNHIDPSMLMISVGTFVDRSRQFAVAGNTPDPATVTEASGPVAYDLTGWDYWVGDDRWDRISFADDIRALPSPGVVGSVLVQLVDDRTLIMETFPDVTRSEISGFTSEARRFTR